MNSTNYQQFRAILEETWESLYAYSKDKAREILDEFTEKHGLRIDELQQEIKDMKYEGIVLSIDDKGNMHILSNAYNITVEQIEHED